MNSASQRDRRRSVSISVRRIKSPSLTIPTKSPPFDTTGTALTRFSSRVSATFSIEHSGPTVTTVVTMTSAAFISAIPVADERPTLFDRPAEDHILCILGCRHLSRTRRADIDLNQICNWRSEIGDGASVPKFDRPEDNLTSTKFARRGAEGRKAACEHTADRHSNLLYPCHTSNGEL